MGKIKDMLGVLKDDSVPFIPGGPEYNSTHQRARIRRTEARQRSGSQYARDHRGEPGRNGGPKGT